MVFWTSCFSTPVSYTHLIQKLEPNPQQPRKDFDEAALAELADSISQHGLIQPITVRPLDTGYYQIIAGERRWRASRMAGLSQVDVYKRQPVTCAGPAGKSAQAITTTPPVAELSRRP